MWIYLIYWIIVPFLCFTSGYVLRALMTNRHRARGTISLVTLEDGTMFYRFSVDGGDPDEQIASKDEILFEILR